LEYQGKVGPPVTAQQVAANEAFIRTQMSRIKQGKTEGIDLETLAKLFAFYKVRVGAILKYVGDDVQKTSAPASPSTYACLTRALL
jgi:DNA-binding Xre family transcriptional regulator